MKEDVKELRSSRLSYGGYGGHRSYGDHSGRSGRFGLSIARLMTVPLALAAVLGALVPSPATAAQTTDSLSEAQALLDQYCVTCHNQRANIADLTLDTKNLAEPGIEPDIWEAVVRKVRTGMMPPQGARRPARESLDGFASWLEGGLDQAALLAPNPGSPTLHRLNRTEYTNAIRDLLALDIDASTLLPVDSSAAGFDNIADVLNTSPALIQGYLSAAMKVSRLAVGDLTAPPSIATYRATAGLSQREHIEGLPLGTTGGMVIGHTFPLDAEYDIQVGGGQGVDFTIDGESVPSGGRGGVRIAVPAGPHTLSAATVRALSSTGVDDTFSAPVGGRGGIQSITITGPFDPTGAGDTPSRNRIFVCRPSGTRAADELACAGEILSTLATRAFRQPIAPSDPAMELFLDFYSEGRAEGSFETGIQRGLARILVDPRFIFRMEQVPLDSAEGEVYSLTDLELASRLSFFVWSSIPDVELLDLASAGRLSDQVVLESQTLRMLADPRAQALIDNFASQWMGLRELENVEPESDDFDTNLRLAFERETKMLFEAIAREDGSIVDLLDADYTFVDERLATHYGIAGVRGSRVRRVQLDADSPRRGILGHGSMLLVTSVANRTSPVTRGKWILENLLGAPPPSPPAGVEVNLDADPDAPEPTTLRARMEQHRTNPVCASCHTLMDPIGFSLENFDLVGKWREFESGRRIDASAELVDGTPLNGPASLRAAMLDRTDAFVLTAAEKLLTYAMGRETDYYDMPAIRSVAREATEADYRFSALVLGVVKSDPFQMRMKGGE
jgi:mono/diheme cytochrome c family protein